MVWNGPLADGDDLEQVELVSPVGRSDCYGIDLYTRTLEFVIPRVIL